MFNNFPLNKIQLKEQCKILTKSNSKTKIKFSRKNNSRKTRKKSLYLNCLKLQNDGHLSFKQHLYKTTTKIIVLFKKIILRLALNFRLMYNFKFTVSSY